MDWLTLVGAIGGLASVVVTGTVAIISVRANADLANAQRGHERIMATLPKRLEALETAWRALFVLQSGNRLDRDILDDLVASSIWLPKGLREQFLSMIATPDATSEAMLIELRARLDEASGSSKMGDNVVMERMGSSRRGDG